VLWHSGGHVGTIWGRPRPVSHSFSSMSKAFYKSSVPPRLLHRWSSKTSSSNTRSIEIYTTTCIVTNFALDGSGSAPSGQRVLLNPSNPQLSGVKNFPYFPKGGPVPKERPSTMHKDWQPLGYVSNWGGMEVGSGMLYPVSVVDGLVHQMAGWQFHAACQWKQRIASLYDMDACPEGQAVKTPTGGDLQQYYDTIIHTTPPFFDRDKEQSCRDLLFQCYKNGLDLAFSNDTTRVTTPLLGAGARGFPEQVAVDVAAHACREWCLIGNNKSNEQIVAFGLLEERLAHDLAAALETASERATAP
jgi:O-acetyl-ADP-ribose deacetylase (regulator of RNase III)